MIYTEKTESGQYSYRYRILRTGRLVRLMLLAFFIAAGSVSLFARNIPRIELLDEGRRFTNTLDAYQQMSDNQYPTGFVGGFILFPDFYVDSNQGRTHVTVGLGKLSLKISRSL